MTSRKDSRTRLVGGSPTERLFHVTARTAGRVLFDVVTTASKREEARAQIYRMLSEVTLTVRRASLQELLAVTGTLKPASQQDPQRKRRKL